MHSWNERSPHLRWEQAGASYGNGGAGSDTHLQTQAKADQVSNLTDLATWKPSTQEVKQEGQEVKVILS